MTISRMQQPRQMYGLGSFVKKAVKGVKGILKSDLGKTALLIGGGMYAGGLGPFAAAGRFGTLPGAGFASGLPGLITGGLDKLGLNVAKGGKPTFGQFSKVFGIGALGGAALEALTAAGLDTDNPNSMPRDVDSLKSYLKQGYLQLNPDKTAQDAEAFAEANTTEYKADGGRIGFAEGMPEEGIETLLPKQKPSPMMQGVDKTIQSIDNFAQLIAQSGDPSSFRGHVDLLSEFIQKNDIDPSAAFDYVKRRVDEIKPGLSKFIFTTTEDMPVEKKAYGGRIGYEIGGPAYDATDASIYGSSAITITPDTIMGPGGNQIQDKMGNNFNKPLIPQVTEQAGNRIPPNNQLNFTPPKTPISMQTPLPGSGGISEIDIPVAGGNNNQMGILPVMPQLPGFSDESFITQPGFPDSDGDGIDDRLSDEEKERRLNPIEGGKLEGPTQPFFPSYNDPLPKDQLLSGFEQYKKNNNPLLSGTLALVPVTLPNGEQFTFRNGAEASAFAQYLQSIGQAPYQRRQDPGMLAEFASGGRAGYAFGTPEQNAMEAAGIEGLPLNQNPAGVKELDLRDSGGFIPPVGVKEKADDIPAMLSNNEFVFTADAVRGMGDGDVNKGAQRMYDMMKKLEGGGRV